MDRSVVAFLEGVVAFTVIAATGMSGVSLWLRSRAQRRPELDSDALDALRQENSELRARMVELEERVDFVERRLVQEQQPPQLPKQAERTPV
jgi:hypothetical protein